MKNSKLIVMLFFTLFLLPFPTSTAMNSLPATPVSPPSTFNPFVAPDVTYDLNHNKIHDHFEAIIKSVLLSDTYTSIVTFSQPLTDVLKEKIATIGGQILSSWSVIHGAAIRIRGTQVEKLAALPGISFITENYQSQALLSTSVPQINVRPYVWDTLGYEGDPNDAIAILDTGIDASHPDFAGKVVYWKDFIGHDASSTGDEYLSATDWNGHGTHVSSIAAGTGAAAGTATTVEVSGTLGIPALDALKGYISQIEVETTGNVHIEVQWDDKDGPNGAFDTLFIAMDTTGDGTFTGDDIIVSGDYDSIPLTLDATNVAPGQYLILIGPYETGEIGRASIQYTVTRPASSTSDGHNKYRGVAPGCKLVGLKVLDDAGVGTQSSFLDAIDWIYNNGLTYNISVVSMSLGFTSTVLSIDQAVNNLVSEGYVCVAAAGNGYLDGDYIYSPGTASKAITVGAIDDVDKIAIYSSNGYTGDAKPDVVAPGGAYTSPLGADEDTHLIIAADTNSKDIVEFGSGTPSTYWETEMTADDYAVFQGTSMATPHVSGLAALIIQAMGTGWTHTETSALKVKNYLCGTATEVRYGETYDTYSQNPTLNRGGRDLVEGFGKVHGDAAIEAFLTEYTAGSTVIGSLGSSPNSKQSWARKVELVENIVFTAGIEMDGSADFDLYLYNPAANFASSNGILAKSTTAGAGSPENLAYTPTNNMTAYLVVKRVSGSGSFTLQAEATKTGTPSPSFFIGVPLVAWAILGFFGLASVVFLRVRKH
ncbi:MAG: S8 family serine peptidase [Candidatus Heimdallarchaeota archaeon]